MKGVLPEEIDFDKTRSVLERHKMNGLELPNLKTLSSR